MAECFDADGPIRYAQSDEHNARYAALRATIEAKYATTLRRANFLRRVWIRFRMAREFRLEWKKIAPSRYSLWYGGQARDAGETH